MKLPKGWGLPARLALVVILELGLRTYAVRSGLAAVLLSPSGASNDIALFVALLLLLVRLAAIWLVLPIAITWALMNLWPRRANQPGSSHPPSEPPLQGL
jgi:hypothetical protein